MNISRRGFLHTLAAATVGLATFDPKSLLWVPAPNQIVRVQADERLITVERAIETQLELNDLALRFAREMTARLERHPAVTLREIMFQYTGKISLDGLITLPDVGKGRFECNRRITATATMGRSADSFVRTAAELVGDHLHDVDMFAPIGAELRPGEPFSDDVAIGVATDPESGLSARALRFDMDRRGGRTETLTMLELAGGRWRSVAEARRERDEQRRRRRLFRDWDDDEEEG